jgi:hypothetical protein
MRETSRRATRSVSRASRAAHQVPVFVARPRPLRSARASLAFAQTRHEQDAVPRCEHDQRHVVSPQRNVKCPSSSQSRSRRTAGADANQRLAVRACRPGGSARNNGQARAIQHPPAHRRDGREPRPSRLVSVRLGRPRSSTKRRFPPQGAGPLLHRSIVRSFGQRVRAPVK